MSQFFRSTTNGFNVSASSDSVALSQSASVRDNAESHVPFVSVAMFMAPDEARELAALLLEAVGHMTRATEATTAAQGVEPSAAQERAS